MSLRASDASPLISPIPSISTAPKSFLALILSFACVLSVGADFPSAAAAPSPAGDKKHKQDAALKGLPITELSADEAMLHALNRLAYGPRPGDVERVRQMGLAKWIEQQLNPNAIEDRAAEARLEQFPTLRMSTAKLLAEYPQAKQAEKQAAVRAARLEQHQEQRSADAGVAASAKDISDKSGQEESAQASHGQSAVEEGAGDIKDHA